MSASEASSGWPDPLPDFFLYSLQFDERDTSATVVFQTPYRPERAPESQYAVEFALILTGVHDLAVDGWADGPAGSASFVAGTATVVGPGWSVAFRYDSAAVVGVRTFQVGPP
ncbi:hypothetical protein ABH931_003429 [Streptacidiphilus sp. MAP12-33]|uniref:hypothetical protein n=1 Tax=Streptacidiphilus sp. MAP12-33 TaxID=3156266 RepID=UPI003517EBF4